MIKVKVYRPKLDERVFTGNLTLDGFTACVRCGALIDRAKAIAIHRLKGYNFNDELFAVYAKHKHDVSLNFCLNCFENMDVQLVVGQRITFSKSKK